MRCQFFFALLSAWVLFAPAARAQISYQYVGIVQGPVVANGSVTVNLYLQETAANNSPSLIASESGLYGAGVNVYLASGTGSTITAINANGATEPNGFTGNIVKNVYN